VRWLFFNTKSVLVESLSKQGESAASSDLAEQKSANAEQLLLEGYRGMVQRKDTIPPSTRIRLSQALQRLVDLYTAWEEPVEAASWQKALDELAKE
jgi:hypothetical protein